jgi:hypothetical protein
LTEWSALLTVKLAFSEIIKEFWMPDAEEYGFISCSQNPKPLYNISNSDEA